MKKTLTTIVPLMVILIVTTATAGETVYKTMIKTLALTEPEFVHEFMAYYDTGQDVELNLYVKHLGQSGYAGTIPKKSKVMIVASMVAGIQLTEFVKIQVAEGPNKGMTVGWVFRNHLSKL